MESCRMIPWTMVMRFKDLPNAIETGARKHENQGEEQPGQPPGEVWSPTTRRIAWNPTSRAGLVERHRRGTALPALATCHCNDIYRRRPGGISLCERVEVEVEGILRRKAGHSDVVPAR
jgi:hypothetical protein